MRKKSKAQKRKRKIPVMRRKEMGELLRTLPERISNLSAPDALLLKKIVRVLRKK